MEILEDFIYFIYLFIYTICHEQNTDNIDNMKNTKAGVAHRKELQLRDPKGTFQENIITYITYIYILYNLHIHKTPTESIDSTDYIEQTLETTFGMFKQRWINVENANWTV